MKSLHLTSHPFKGEGKGGDGVAPQFSSPFVTAGRHESFCLKSSIFFKGDVLLTSGSYASTG